jgi:hypothetical protein
MLTMQSSSMAKYIHCIQLFLIVKAVNLKSNYGVRNGLVENFMAKN